MTTTTPWSDTPPSEAGDFHIKCKATGEERVGCIGEEGALFWRTLAYAFPGSYYKFGPRVLSAEETVKLTAEVERLRADNRILNERYDLLEQENDSLRRNGVVIYAGSEELQQLRAAAAELAEIHKAWRIGGRSS